MSVPQTVETALADRPVEGATCLEAGAGVGNTTRGLLEQGAGHVYAVTNNAEHARDLRSSLTSHEASRTSILEADLQSTPLESNAVDLITAHGLCNVVPPAVLGRISAELARIAAPGAHLVVDDYEPLPDDAAISDLFAVENAASELADGTPALTFYPSDMLRRVFEGHGLTFDRKRILLDPVPWTISHVEAHANLARKTASNLPRRLADPLAAELDRLVEEIGSESTGTMYSLAFRMSER